MQHLAADIAFLVAKESESFVEPGGVIASDIQPAPVLSVKGQALHC